MTMFGGNTAPKGNEQNGYDNTNTLAVWPAKDTSSLEATGRINLNGWDTQAALIQNTTKNGKEVVEVYVKVGAIFPNRNKKSDKAPDFSGPLELNGVQLNQIALWNRGDEKSTISGSLSFYEKEDSDTPF